MIHALSQWFQFNYMPAGQPFYQGADWPNAFILCLLGPLGWLWSRTKYWPLKPLHRSLEHLHARLDEHATRHDEHAAKLDLILGHLGIDGGRGIEKSAALSDPHAVEKKSLPANP